MVDKKFVRLVEDACESSLINVGFKKLRRESVVWEVAPGFLGWIGLNQGNHQTYLRINPFVGIHSVDVMKLWAQFDGEKYSKGASATYAIHIGELIPEELTYEFHSEEQVFAEADRLAKDIFNTGLPYMRSIASYEALLPLIEARMPMLGGYPERYALILYLSGKPDQAREFVEGVLDKKENLAQFSNEFFTTFGVNFLKYTESK